MTFQGLRFLLSLSVILELIYRPGSSQLVSSFKCCQIVKPWKESYFSHLVEKASYAVCRTNIIEFTLPRGYICLDQSKDKRVEEVISCINRGRQVCLVKPTTSTVSSTRSAPNNDASTQSRMIDKHAPTQAPVPDVPDSHLNGSEHLNGTSPPAMTSHTESQQAWPKVSDEKPPTSPDSTTRSAANKDVSTQRQDGRSQKPTGATGTDGPTTLTFPLTTKASDSNANGNDRLHDGAPSEGDDGTKMKQMKIAIISLIGIIFAITVVGTALWCRRRRPKGNLPYDERPVCYSVAQSEDSIS
ncbi:uncharacterized protein LOC134936052 isoform X1 [Pseudophryne corroboree]|uniref:uncharacterized protein LOC134936052 isoform X1 n=1 Tax=Pseudophryne corroboree TaxID=495146 RepID=UPI003081EB42